MAARTVIGIDIAVAALVASVTCAAVAVDFISARACVQARSGEALVDVVGAAGAIEASYARTAVAVDFISARACVQARSGEALVNIAAAVAALVASLTGAAVAVDFISTRGSVFARIGLTLIGYSAHHNITVDAVCSAVRGTSSSMLPNIDSGNSAVRLADTASIDHLLHDENSVARESKLVAV